MDNLERRTRRGGGPMTIIRAKVWGRGHWYYVDVHPRVLLSDVDVDVDSLEIKF
jgi:hypothetical protein